MNPHYFEWFYIDVHQEDGYDVVITLHTHPFMSQFEIGIFDIFIYYQNQPLLHRFFVFPQEEMQRTGDSLIKVDNQIKLNFKIEKSGAFLDFALDPVHLQLELTQPEISGLPLTEELFEENQAKSFQWQLLLPMARATGKINILPSGEQSLKQLPIEGIGYLDSNYGNINLKKEVSYWLWAKIKWQDGLLIAGKVKTKDGNIRDILVKYGQGEVAVDQQARIEFTGQQLNIDSALGQYQLALNNVKVIDDLRFLISTAPKIFSLPMKVIEVLAGIAVQKKSLKWLTPLLTNGRYFRKRWLATSKTGEKVEIFGEEMFLNE